MKVLLSIIIIAVIIICTALDAHHVMTIRTAGDTLINPGTIQTPSPNIVNPNDRPPSSLADTSKKKLVLPDTFHIRG